jgi:hypothetical protein
VRWVFTAIVVGMVTALWSRINFSRSPHQEFGSEGNITPGKVSAAIITLLGVAVTLFGVALIFTGMLATGLMCFVAGVALTVFMGPSLTHRHDVSWNSKAVTGPSRLFGPSLGYRRTTIQWIDIVSTGKTVTEYWYIQGNYGQRIYWSYLYPGYGKFVDSLKVNRPQVVLPDDLQ